MQNGNKKEMRVFLHQNRQGEFIPCYDLGAGFMYVKDYHYYRDELRLSDTELISKMTFYKDLIDEQEIVWQEEKEKIKITNLKELMRFVYKQLNKEQKEEIKKAVDRGVKDKELINYFPEPYKEILMLRYDHDLRKGYVAKKEKVENIVKTISITKEDEEVLNKEPEEIYDSMDDILAEQNINNPFI